MTRKVRQSRSTPERLEVRLLGGFGVALDGAAVDDERWPRRKARALVKLLALAPGRRMHAEQLADALWPGSLRESGANNLNKVVHMVRRALEPDLATGARSAFVERRSGRIRLFAPGSLVVDAAEFEREALGALRGAAPGAYEEALELYAGDLLPEDVYEDWSVVHRDRLRRLHRELLWAAAAAHDERGNLPRATELLHELIALEPADEKAHRRLMRLHGRAGRRELALQQYELCRAALQEHLGIAPATDTETLRAALVAGAFPVDERVAQGPVAVASPADSLAVLPFAHAGGEALEYLGAGVAESLIHALSRLPGLRVMAPSTVLRYAGRTADPCRAGEELGVVSVLTGRVEQWSERLVVSVELVRVADGSLLWGERYDREASDVFSVQREISQKISAGLHLELTGAQRARLGRRQTESTEAYRHYVEGRHHWNKRTAEGLRQGIACFAQAIDADPAYALAYCGLADGYALSSLYGVVPSHEAMPRARSAAQRALELDDGLAEAHTSLAYTRLYYDWDWSGAEAGFRRAIELSPSYATAHQWLHELLTATGRFDEQREAVRRAEELDPLSPIIKTEGGWGLYFARDFEGATRRLERTIEMAPRFSVAWLILGLARLQQRRFAEAVASVEHSLELSSEGPFALAVGFLGHARARAGDAAGARAELARLDEMGRLGETGPGSGPAYGQALVHAGLGESDAALACLQRSFEQRADRMIFLGVEPVFDVLRDLAGFRELVRRVGLPS